MEDQPEYAVTVPIAGEATIVVAAPNQQEATRLAMEQAEDGDCADGLVEVCWHPCGSIPIKVELAD